MKIEKLPKKVRVIDVVYKITCVDKPSEVDIFGRQTLWGQCDFWTRTIRIYHNGRQRSDIMQTVWHEIIHAICEKTDIAQTSSKDLGSNEKAVDLLATGINAVLLDNPGS